MLVQKYEIIRYFGYFCRMKLLCSLLGTLALALGVVGMFVPLLPTTPFLLLSAALYFRGSPRLYRRLLAHRRLGPYIRNFRELRAIPLRVKVVSVSLTWATILYCVFFLPCQWWQRALLLAVAVGVSLHILSYKTLPPNRSLDRPQ